MSEPITDKYTVCIEITTSYAECIHSRFLTFTTGEDTQQHVDLLWFSMSSSNTTGPNIVA